MHRHTLHGIAPWTARADAQGRAMAYFRPEVNDPEVWFRAW
jgi:hypothetical protein